MGAGQFRAGAGRAGFDPPQKLAAKPVAQYAAALAYSPQLRGFVYSSVGSSDVLTALPLIAGTADVQSMDPVDQKVAMLIGIEFGALPSAPSQFNKLRTVLSRVPASRQPTIARQELNRVLKPLLDAGDIAVQSVSVDTVGAGVVQVFLSYQNLRSGTTITDMPVTSNA